MTKIEIITMMRNSNSKKEWNSNCDKVKHLCKTGQITEVAGDYPVWWWQEIVVSGLSDAVFSRFH